VLPEVELLFVEVIVIVSALLDLARVCNGSADCW
jgi:hypothetical protein